MRMSARGQRISTSRKTTDSRPAKVKLAQRKANIGQFRSISRDLRMFTVFLLVKKLTTGGKGPDKLFICRRKTIEPVIRTFQRGWEPSRLSKTTSKSSSSPPCVHARRKKPKLRSRA